MDDELPRTFGPMPTIPEDELLPLSECLAGTTVRRDRKERQAFADAVARPPSPQQMPASVRSSTNCVLSPTSTAARSSLSCEAGSGEPQLSVYAVLRDETLPELNAALGGEYAAHRDDRAELQGAAREGRERAIAATRLEQQRRSLANVRTIALGGAPVPQAMAEFLARGDVGHSALDTAASAGGGAPVADDPSSLFTNFEVRCAMQVSASNDAARLSLLDRKKKKVQRSLNYPVVKHFDEPAVADSKKAHVSDIDKWRHRMQLDEPL